MRVLRGGVDVHTHLDAEAAGVRTADDFASGRQRLSEDEAISLMSVAVDFGITQVVDGDWGVHAAIDERVFAGG